MTHHDSLGTLGIALAGSLLALGALAGCGDDEVVAGCQEGTRQDCTLTAGGAGERICVAGVWSACQAKSCTDGSTMSCTQANGSPGQMLCQDGAWTACGPIPGQCIDDTYQKCTTASGGDGYQHCVNGVWGPCEDEAACKDGQQQSCSTACGVGTEICVNGLWQNCTAPEPQQEICDGVDNDCNGDIDETCACVHGKCEPCYSGPPSTRGIGACQDGQRCCDTGAWGVCQNEVTPAAQEDCVDTIDNDCDGTVNDGCACTVGQIAPCGSDVGECVKGTQVCQDVGGTAIWGECLNATLPQPEKNFGCDGKDNDCDGPIDNNLPADEFDGLGFANESCNTAEAVDIEDSFSSDPPYEWTLSIYPAGDVDYYYIKALETSLVILPPCVPWPLKNPGDPQCNYLDVELISPQVTGLQYEFLIMTGTCSVPTQTFNSTTTKTVQWDGECGLDDSREFWLKVQPTVSSSPAFSCHPYTLRVKYWRVNESCS